MVAGLKSMDYETRLAVFDLFPLEYRHLRGDLILTYALFEQGISNRFSTVDPANTRRGHGKRQPLNDKNKTDPENLGESIDPVYQSVNKGSSCFNASSALAVFFVFSLNHSQVCVMIVRQFDSLFAEYVPVYHWRVHLDICTFKCRLCTKSYKFLRGLRKHVRTAHTGQIEIRTGKSVEEIQESVNKGCLCSECGKFVKRCDNLQVHQKTIHDQLEQYACALCGHVFNRRTNYFRHIRTMHGKEDQTNCQQCRQSPSAPLELESDYAQNRP
ncbi:KRAB domain-containing zinc finger protein [Clonorchis sinensis]|uniref:KRAB domain-containing zinc finger protein n=1 Tax=Clonorchis sinensis TaxID=79923 RepID=G7YMI6_CLOSI|nr:KRAB domain-containing zinc finger protein [Clonorchis sinensis]